MPIEILLTDTIWYTSPDAGHPHCICSRCGKLIKENDVPIRAWPETGTSEYRFHSECLGFKTSKYEPTDFDDDFPY